MMLETIDVSVISFIILLFILTNAYRRSETSSIQDRLFRYLVIVNMVLIAIDILGWVFNGLSGQLNLILNTGFNLLLYLAAPLAPSIWVLYIYCQVYQDCDKVKRTYPVLVISFLVNAAISVASLFTGWFFYVDAQNIYHRGDLFGVHLGYNYALIAYSIILLLKNRRLLEKKYFILLLIFYIPQITGTLIQSFDYGVSYNWAGMAISLLMIYLNIQSRSLNTDYLTGVYNRRQLDQYAKAKLRNVTSEQSFSAVMFDLDGFKQINDRFGHDVGDDALKDAAHIIKNSLRKNDFVARVGGDEFVAILDVNNTDILQKAVGRIEENVKDFNRHSAKPYSISFSIGYDIYGSHTKMKLDDFFKHVDDLMYKNKREKENVQGSGLESGGNW